MKGKAVTQHISAEDVSDVPHPKHCTSQTLEDPDSDDSTVHTCRPDSEAIDVDNFMDDDEQPEEEDDITELSTCFFCLSVSLLI